MGLLSSTCCRKRVRLIRGFNGVCVLVFILFLACKEYNRSQETANRHDHSIYGRRILQSTIESSDEKAVSDSKGSIRDSINCPGIYRHEGFNSKCDYIRANPDCNSAGFLNYLVFFYCYCSKFQALGYVVLAILLVCAFYLLGSTASDYFCCCLEKLSKLLKFPPTVSGVTLLPLGNGAPDVFSGIAAFVGQNSGDVGFSSVLGGALFVTCIVVGVVSFFVADKNLQIDKKCFIRDVGFFLVAIFSLCIIMAVGEVSVVGALAFVSIYFLYVFCVAAKELLRKQWGWNLWSLLPESPVRRYREGNIEDESNYIPLIQLESDEVVTHLVDELPHWAWSTNVAIYSLETVLETEDDRPIHYCNCCSSFYCSKLLSIFELPLVIPRRLTIPIVNEGRWSKGYAVSSACLAPILLAFLWSSQEGVTPAAKLVVYFLSCSVGVVLSLYTLMYTQTDHPPERFLLAWVSGGFLMSIVWFYIIANELVALLTTLGIIFELRPSLLAFTILAWGNSLGDLVSNTTIAKTNEHGVQIAMSGCYAGPIFNTLIGLGISLLLKSWSEKPAPYMITADGNLYLSLGFLMLSLVWSLFVLPRNDMRPSRFLGFGLVIIYLTFLALGATAAL